MQRRTRFVQYRSWRGALHITPLVDIVFQLIVFFMVVSQVVTVEHVPIKLPEPHSSQARAKGDPKLLVLNLFSDSQGRLIRMKVNAQVVRDTPALTDLLLRFNNASPRRESKVIVRADRRVHFAEVQKVLEALANAGVVDIEIATENQGVRQ